jgi:hypothetical protein
VGQGPGLSAGVDLHKLAVVPERLLTAELEPLEDAPSLGTEIEQKRASVVKLVGQGNEQSVGVCLLQVLKIEPLALKSWRLRPL